MVSRSRESLIARRALGAVSTNFWSELSKAGKAEYELVVRTHFSPDLIHRLGRMGTFIRERRDCAVGGVLGPAEYLETTRFMSRPNDPDGRRLPGDAMETKLMWDYYRLARGARRLGQVVDTNYWESLTTVFLKDANFAGTARLMNDVREYERTNLAPNGIHVGFAGDVALSQSLIKGITDTQIWSLIFSVVGILIVTAVLGGSLRWGVFCVLPSLLAVIMKLAIMGWADIPFGVATSMFAAMTLGIGVNCSIQLLEGMQRPNTKHQTPNTKPPAGLIDALKLTGPPALLNTLAVSLGFGVLMLSQVPANARLGLLVVLGLVECFVASLALLPVLVSWWPGSQFKVQNSNFNVEAMPMGVERET
jgi:predicted RND superfamily exporter protein